MLVLTEMVAWVERRCLGGKGAGEEVEGPRSRKEFPARTLRVHSQRLGGPEGGGVSPAGHWTEEVACATQPCGQRAQTRG